MAAAGADSYAATQTQEVEHLAASKNKRTCVVIREWCHLRDWSNSDHQHRNAEDPVADAFSLASIGWQHGAAIVTPVTISVLYAVVVVLC